MEHVDAIDVSPAMIELAERRTPATSRACSVTSLREPLLRLARALRPGVVLAAVALPRPDLRRELPAELFAAVGHRLLGVGFAGLRAVHLGEWYRHEPTHDVMPVNLDPPLSTRQVQQIAAATLPRSHVRRLVFWRYLLHWQRPETA